MICFYVLSSARITQVQKLGNTCYILSFERDVEVIIPGITGLGRACLKTTHGLNIENNVLTVTTWGTIPDQDFDFSQPHEFNLSLLNNKPKNADLFIQVSIFT